MCLNIYKYFASYIFSTGKLQGSKLLEIGSAASVHSVASASKYFPNIVLSDYVEDNLEELRKWLKGQSSFKQMLDVHAELEGYGKLVFSIYFFIGIFTEKRSR